MKNGRVTSGNQRRLFSIENIFSVKIGLSFGISSVSSVFYNNRDTVSTTFDAYANRREGKGEYYCIPRVDRDKSSPFSIFPRSVH